MYRIANDLFLAVSYFTRLPVDRWVNYNHAALDRANAWFPLAGWLVGFAATAVLLLSALWLPLPVAILLAMAMTALATGAFHEDGLADTADGFGPVGDREKALAAMKDSRLGVYGLLATIFILGLKFLALNGLQSSLHAALALFAAQPLSRFAALSLILVLPQVSGAASHTRAVARRLPIATLVIALITTLPALALLAYLSLLAVPTVLIALTATLAIFMRLCRARFGGYTGDCLGAAQQISETVILLACVTAAGEL